MGDPLGSNSSPAGVARFSTLRAWLSQWSFDDTQAKALDNAPQITVPLLAIENSADNAIPQRRTKLFYDTDSSKDCQFHVIRGANHYYSNQADELSEAVKIVQD